MYSEDDNNKNHQVATEGSYVELGKMDNKSNLPASPDHAAEQDQMTGDEAPKGSNTIMEQITLLAKASMNEQQADQTIADHKYLLENVENRCAILFFAMTYRNQSLFEALQRYYKKLVQETEVKL